MKQKQVDISIIIPIYNVGDYLEECLDSVLQQNFRNMELVCVNDASTDSSLEILERYQKKYENITIVQHVTNRGVSAARNSGLDVAQGKYIVFVDPDDQLAHSKCLQELWEQVEQQDAEIVYFNYRKFWDKVPSIEYSEDNIKDDTIQSGKELFCNLVENGKMEMEVWRQVFKRSFLEDNRIRFYEGIIHEDELFTFLSLMNAERVVRVKRIYYLYRQRAGSIMTIKDSRRAESVFTVMAQWYKYWAGQEFTEREHRAIEKYMEFLNIKYREYRYFVDGSNISFCGGIPERHMYKLSQENCIVPFTAKQLGKLAESKCVVVYGAGVVAKAILYFLKKTEVDVRYIVVTDKEKNPESVYGIPVIEVQELVTLKTDAVVVIGVKKDFASEVIKMLEEKELSYMETSIVSLG